MANTQLPGTQVKDTSITVDDLLDSTITNAKLANMSAGTVKMRHTGSTGAPEDTTLSDLKSDLSLNNVDNTSDTTKNAAAVTLTNKRKQPRVYSTTSIATLTPEIASYDTFKLTAQSGSIVIANHSTSTPVDGEMMLMQFYSSAGASITSFGTTYAAGQDALPTAIPAAKWLQLLFVWENGTSKWILLGKNAQA